MKTKEQKRQEAIERACRSYETKNWQRYGVSLEEYLDKFRPQRERAEGRV
jgi:hypothetical protein